MAKQPPQPTSSIFLSRRDLYERATFGGRRIRVREGRHRLKRRFGSIIIGPGAAATCRIEDSRKIIKLCARKIIADIARRYATDHFLEIELK